MKDGDSCILLMVDAKVGRKGEKKKGGEEGSVSVAANKSR
jgi:hypothetical protein